MSIMIYIIKLSAKHLNIERLTKAVHWTFCAVQPVKTTVQHKLLNLNSSNSYHLHAKLRCRDFRTFSLGSPSGAKQGKAASN